MKYENVFSLPTIQINDLCSIGTGEEGEEPESDCDCGYELTVSKVVPKQPKENERELPVQRVPFNADYKIFDVLDCSLPTNLEAA